MQPNRVKRIMREGGLALGTSVGFADPEVIELIGIAGYDAVFIDMEHTPLDLQTAQEMICRAELAGVTSIIRVPDNNPKTILRLLDVGAQGIHIPHIDDLEDARRAVQAVRYYPAGDRGSYGGGRAARFGTIPWPEHVRTSNEEILLAVTIEDARAVESAEALASLDGVDMLFVGPSDLATSMGIFENNHPKVRQAVESIAAIVRRVGKAKLGFVLQHSVLNVDVPGLLKLGVSYALCLPGPQGRLLASFRQQVSQAHSQMPKAKPS